MMQLLHRMRTSLLQRQVSFQSNWQRYLSTGQRILHSQLQELVDCFPPVLHAFGYGSGVFVQDNNHEGIMVDIILVVENAIEWHAQNLQRHKHHYALLPKLGGAHACARIQRIPPGVYFHANVALLNQRVKYGVVQVDMLQDDLQYWKYLYLAGRLHKPTVCIVQQDEIMQYQHDYNLPAALATSLLLLSKRDSSIQQHTLTAIYQQIASLSYAGDLRMSVGAEDPLKIPKLVHSQGQVERWNELYKDSLMDCESRGILSICDNDIVEYDIQESRDEFVRKLTPCLQEEQDLTSALANIVAPAARNQTLKGLLTAGLFQSARYALAKFQKGILKQ